MKQAKQLENLPMFNPYKSAIEACVHCAQDCERYAAEFAGTFGKTVRCCLDAAEVCMAAATLMSRGSGITREICQLSAHACQLCAAECDKSPDEQLANCAESCRACAQECLKIVEEGPFDMEVQGSGISASVAAAI